METTSIIFNIFGLNDIVVSKFEIRLKNTYIEKGDYRPNIYLF